VTRCVSSAGSCYRLTPFIWFFLPGDARYSSAAQSADNHRSATEGTSFIIRIAQSRVPPLSTRRVNTALINFVPQETKAGLAVGKLRLHSNRAVADLAKEVVKVWKAAVEKHKSKTSKTSTPTATTPAAKPAPSAYLVFPGPFPWAVAAAAELTEHSAFDSDCYNDRRPFCED